MHIIVYNSSLTVIKNISTMNKVATIDHQYVLALKTVLQALGSDYVCSCIQLDYSHEKLCKLKTYFDANNRNLLKQP